MFTVPSHGTDGPPTAREVEIARLTEIVEALVAGQGSVVEITGEAGIGKTLLATSLTELALRHGLPVARAHAVRGNTTPYQVFRDAWEARTGFDRSAEDNSAEYREALDQPSEWAAGGVLLLDDLHWCDRSSAELAARLIRCPGSTPYVLAVAHRPRQTSPLLLEALDHGVGAGTVTRIEPGPLGADAVAALLDTWRGPEATPEPQGTTESREFVERLCAAAGGNPRHLRLLVGAGWHPDHWPDHPGADTDGLLREARPLIAELEALTPDAATTARAAAVLGDQFRPEEVAQVSGIGLERTLDALAEIIRADLMQPARWGGRLSFRHRVVGHVAHESADLSFRLRAHQRALDMIAERGGRADEQARHAEHLLGTDGATAARILSEGAAEIVTRAPATAARWLRLALECPPDSGRGASRTTMELACCRALIAAGRLEEARALAHELLGERSQALTDQQRMQAQALCARAERLLCRCEEAEAVARTALQALPRPLPDPLPAEAVELILEYGLVHILRGTHDQARALLHEASQARSEADPAARTALRVLAAFCDTYLGHLEQGVRKVTRCAGLVDALPDAVAGHAPETLALLGSAEICLERYTDAYRHLDRGLRATSASAPKHVLMRQLLGLSVLDQWTGRLDEAQRRAREAEQLARSMGSSDGMRLATALRAAALVWARGRQYTDEAVALAEQAVGSVHLGAGWWSTSAIGLLAQTRLLGGDAAGALRTLMDSGGGEGLPLIQPALRPSLLALAATAALGCGDSEAARRLVVDAESDAERLELRAQWACVRRARAQLHLAEGEHDAAAKLFELAAAGFRLAGLPVQHAWTLVAGARAVHEVHGQAVACAQLEAAVTLARPCGAVLVREQAARVRAELTESDEAARHLTLLSDREREIAELAAEGLRSRQIAERLFLSPRTVDTHLARVYRKLGISSRLALANLLRPSE